MVNRFCVARCCCGGTPAIPCNPEGVVYPANRIYVDSDFTVASDYLGWDEVTGKSATPPWSPAAYWTYNGFFYTLRYPLGTSWLGDTTGGGEIDLIASDNSFSMYGNLLGTTTTSTFVTNHSTAAGATTPVIPLWNPCDKNTFNLSFTHSHTVSPPADWLGATQISEPYTEVTIIDSQSLSSPLDFVTVRVFSKYDRDNDTYDNLVEVTVSGTSTDYSFGTSSTAAPAIDIALTITPEARDSSANKWRLTFDIDAGGTALTIPDEVFELRTLSNFGLRQGSTFSTNGGTHDKYKVSNLSTSLTDIVIP